VVLALTTAVSGCGLFSRRTKPADSEALVDALRTGGYVLYLRHAATEGSDARALVLEDCATQQKLSEAGQQQAHEIGAAFHRLLIPVGEVRSSPYCRCADTARLAFDRVLLDADLAPLSNTDATQRAARLVALQRLLATPPLAGTNTVLVSHSDDWTALGEPPLEVGELAVVKPLGAAHQLIARVPVSAWPAIADPGVR